jgi:hypothetical protein
VPDRLRSHGTDRFAFWHDGITRSGRLRSIRNPKTRQARTGGILMSCFIKTVLRWSPSERYLPRRSTDPASLRRETCSHVRPPDVASSTGRAGMRPGRALVQYGRAGTPAVDDAGATGRAMATGPASVRGVSGTNAGNDGEKSRDQKGSHTALLFWPRVKPNPRLKFQRDVVAAALLRWQRAALAHPRASARRFQSK